MKQTVATAWALLLLLFLLPLLLAKGGGPAAEETPLPTGSLPLDRTVITPSPASSDSRISVRVDLGDGEILTLPLDKYLWRVVAAEMPASFEEEALKAQTCAARTYTAVLQKSAGSKHPDADICGDSTCCQAYTAPALARARWGLNAGEYSGKLTAAIADTDGLGILCDGAKPGCAFKMCIATEMAFTAAETSLGKVSLGFYDGMADSTLAKTLEHIKEVVKDSSPALSESLVNVIIKKTEELSTLPVH